MSLQLGIFLSLVLLVFTWAIDCFFKRVDRLLYIIEIVNKVPSEQDEAKAPTDEEFKRQAHEFVDDGKEKTEPDEIVIETLDEGRRVNVKPADKKAAEI